MISESEYEFEKGAESQKRGCGSEEKECHAAMSQFVYMEVSIQTNGQRCHSCMSSFSHEEKKMVQAGMELRQKKTQGEKREARSLPHSKMAPKAQKGVWETQLFYIIDQFIGHRS